MALGFGFNKVKVLAQAEKFVQQGKLPNAIAEYEKIIKEDPKDLTVLNTVGDLYARMGSNEQATYYFKRVGDQYAQNGFTVKAIAIYKKLTKTAPFNAENTTKLAELYGQQGLFNDARVHYMQVADQMIKSGEHNQAARIFQKILELDPENAHTQAKLADLYQKLGKKDEARNIYYTAAESLYARGSYAAAEEALDKVLALDPTNAGALMLRGMLAVDSGDSQAAVIYLEQVSDLDSRPDGLRALLRAKLHTGNPEGVEGVANKLLTTHNDITGITTVAQWYVTNNHLEKALRLYEANAERIFAGNQAALQETLYPLMNRAKDNPAALAILNRLLNQAGDHSQSAEMI
ncbi:MAG: tetratricopeptide repeat protein, partial [Candidatus Angelobacter sp.]